MTNPHVHRVIPTFGILFILRRAYDLCMKRVSSSALVYLGVALSLLVMPASSYAATVIIQQPLASTSTTGYSVRLGTGLSGTVGLTQYGFSVSGVSTDVVFRFICFTSSSYSSECGGPGVGEYNFTVYKSSLTGDSSPRLYIATSTDRVLVFDSSKFYRLDHSGGGDGFLGYGTSTASASGAYVIYNDGSPAPVSAINYQSSPTNQQITFDAFPTFSFNYTNVDLYDIAGGTLVDLTANQDVAVPEETHAANGTFTYSETLNLTSGHFYVITPYIRASGSGLRVVGDQVFFSAVSQANTFASLVASTTAEGSSASDCNPLSFDGFKCLKWLVVPDASSTVAMAQVLVQNVGVGGPVVLASELSTALISAQAASTSAATSSLPALVFTLPTGFPGGGAMFTLTPWDDLLGPGTLLSSATNPNTGHTLYDIVYPGWSLFVYTMFVITFGSELIGVGGKWVTTSL